MSKVKNTEQIREQILEAANERFQVYGFNKTTMAEIAEDCGMSPANLYRYFRNKMDIVAHLAEQCMGEERRRMQQIVDDESRSASVRLRELVFVQLHHQYEQYAQRPKMNELVDVVCREHQEIVDDKIAAKLAMLAALLEQGNRQGEFAVADPQQTADAILSATVVYGTPFFIPMFPLAELERKAENSVQLILRGILKR